MKILAPLNSFADLPTYIAAGADEFYLGYYDTEFFNRFGAYAEMNKMSSIKGSDFADFAAMERAVSLIREAGKGVFLTFNSLSYTEAQLDYLRGVFEKVKKLNPDGLIIGAPELTDLALEMGLPVCISSMANVYNRIAVGYYADRGAKRIILPRDLSLDEVDAVCRAYPQTEIEVFFMRVGCKYSDPHCLCLHGGKYGGICGSLSKAKTRLHDETPSFERQHDFEFTHYLYEAFFHRHTACGLCAIWRLLQSGVTTVKIVGRYENSQAVCEDIRNTRANIAIAQTCATQQEYLQRMQYPADRAERCKMGMCCYYPESRF